MSSDRLPPTIDLAFGRSRRLALILLAGYSLAVAAVFQSGLPWWGKLAATLVLSGSGLWLVANRALAAGPLAIVRWVWQADGDCEWQTCDGRFRSARMVPGVLVTPFLVVVRLRYGRFGRRTLSVAPDAVDREAFRRLRARLIIAPPCASPPRLRRVWRLLAGRFRRAKPWLEKR